MVPSLRVFAAHFKRPPRAMPLKSQTRHFAKGRVWLKVYGQVQQDANQNRMVWAKAEQIANLPEAVALFPDAIIDCGTPKEVSHDIA